MNREIKFRALKDDMSNCSWVYGCLLYINEIPRIQVENTDVIYSTCLKGTEGQFTGFKDKNGKGNDTYEGDIIGRQGCFHEVIVWHKNGFYTYSINNPERLYPLYMDEYDEIIGNIHENSELLK